MTYFLESMAFCGISPKWSPTSHRMYLCRLNSALKRNDPSKLFCFLDFFIFAKLIRCDIYRFKKVVRNKRKLRSAMDQLNACESDKDFRKLDRGILQTILYVHLFMRVVLTTLFPKLCNFSGMRIARFFSVIRK
jgi:hypothetical protein